MMLDTKRSWDELVLRHAPDEATAYRILDNRLYHNVTSRFVQSHDYIAMERLYDLHASGTYDLIVVDTPPTRNAIDFLEAPARMSEFFGGRLLRWLTMPYRISGARGARMISVASRPFYNMADRVLGSQFLQDIAEFFLNFQSMYAGFVERAHAVEQLLHDRRTTFAVVTTLEGAPLREAETFCAELTARDFHLGALVLNKTLPDYLLSEDGDHAAAILERDAEPLAVELASATRSRARRARRSARHGARSPHARRLVPELRGGRTARGGVACRARATPRCGGERAELRLRHHRRRRARTRRGVPVRARGRAGGRPRYPCSGAMTTFFEARTKTALLG